MNVLVIDTGGTHVRILVSGQTVYREFESGPKLTPKHMESGVRKPAADRKHDVVSIGYPGPVLRNRPVSDPWKLGGGNVHKLKKLPDGCRMGDNTHAFRGGFRLWNEADVWKSFTFGKQRPLKHQRTRFDPREKARKTQV